MTSHPFGGPGAQGLPRHTAGEPLKQFFCCRPCSLSLKRPIPSPCLARSRRRSEGHWRPERAAGLERLSSIYIHSPRCNKGGRHHPGMSSCCCWCRRCCCCSSLLLHPAAAPALGAVSAPSLAFKALSAAIPTCRHGAHWLLPSIHGAMKRGLANAMHKLPPCLAMTRYSRPCSVENEHKWETNYPMIL